MGTIMETMGPELEQSVAWDTIYPYMHTIDYSVDFIMQIMDKQDGMMSDLHFISNFFFKLFEFKN